MRSIKLTCEQRRVLLAMRDLYLRNMGALVRRRQQLSAELQVRVCTSLLRLQTPCYMPEAPSALLPYAYPNFTQTLARTMRQRRYSQALECMKDRHSRAQPPSIACTAMHAYAA